MGKEYKQIISIGSSTISIAGVFLDKGNCGKFFHKECEHDGLNKTFFKNPEKLVSIFEKLIFQCAEKQNKDVKDVYVLLPQRFFRFKHGVNSIKIKDAVNIFDVNELIENSYEEIEDCEKSECIPIAFRLQDDYIDNPIGQDGDTLEMIYVSVGILSRVKEFFEDLSKRLNVFFTLIPVTNPILNKLKRELNVQTSSRILLNFDKDCIDVCYCEMGAVISSKIVDVGSNDFVSALCNINKIYKDVAEELLRHVNFNLNIEKNSDSYVVSLGKGKMFDTWETNESIKKIIKYISAEILSALDLLIGNAVLPIYMTGNAMCEIKGLDKILSERLCMPVSTIKPDYLTWTNAEDYAMVGMIESFFE